ncbi:WD40-repeat-containing domain protein [Haematococcus lacustris]
MAQEVVVAAAGGSIRILHTSAAQSSQCLCIPSAHKGAVRCLAISSDGALLLSGSDDKTCKLWDLATQQCISTWSMLKKLSACAFTLDCKYVLFADKFGDVAVAAVRQPGSQAGQEGAGKPDSSDGAELLLGHLCSVITSLAVSPDNKLLASTDKDGRVRLSLLPPGDLILKGAYEIQSFCLGHSSFVTSAAFTTPGPRPASPPAPAPGQQQDASSDASATLLVTGSGDGSVKLWEPGSGQLLHSFQAAQPPIAATPLINPSAEPSANTTLDGGAGGGGEGGGRAALPDPVGRVAALTTCPAAAAHMAPHGVAVHGAAHAAGGQSGVAVGEQSRTGEEGVEGKQQDEQEEEEEEQGCEEEEEEEGEGGQQVAPSCPAVHHVSCSPKGSLVCVVVEGEQEVQVLRLLTQPHQLQLLQRLCLPGLHYPCASSWDSQGRCWVVGGPPLDSSQALHLAAFTVNQEGKVEVVSPSCVPESELAAMEQRQGAEEAVVQQGGLEVQWTLPLQRRRYEEHEKEEHMKKRNDLKEHKRLEEIRKKKSETKNGPKPAT